MLKDAISVCVIIVVCKVTQHKTENKLHFMQVSSSSSVVHISRFAEGGITATQGSYTLIIFYSDWLKVYLGPVHTNPDKFENIFLPLVWPTVHTNFLFGIDCCL